MRTVFLLLMLWVLPVGAFGAAKQIKVLLITGGHGFEQSSFYGNFENNPGIALTKTEHGKSGSEAYDRSDLLDFDVVVLYDMVQKITPAQKQRFLSLFDKGIGLVVLHHALVSYQDWMEFERIIGGRYPEDQTKKGHVTQDVGYQHDVQVPVKIVAKDHPVTHGIKDFVLHDEIYWGYRVGNDVKPLLTTTHAKSGKPLAWTRKEKSSRVVYIQCGHGPEAYGNANYQKLVSQAIAWAAKKKSLRE